MSILSVMLILSSSAATFSFCPQSFPALGSFPISRLIISWPESRKFSYGISPSNEYSGLISFRIDWFDFLVVQGTLKSLLQHHSPKASVLRCSAFFTVQLSHPYMTTRKPTALTIWTFVSKGMSLFFNGPTLTSIEGEKVDAVTDFIFLVSKITADSDCTMKLKDPCSLKRKL